MKIARAGTRAIVGSAVNPRPADLAVHWIDKNLIRERHIWRARRSNGYPPRAYVALAHFRSVDVGGMMLALDVVAKVGALIDAEQAVDTRDNPADHSAHRAAVGPSLRRAFSRAVADALRVNARRKQRY